MTSSTLSGNSNRTLPPFSMPRCSLFVFEQGAPAPIDLRAFVGEVVTIVQDAAEQPADFAQRALLRIDSCRRSGQRFDEAVLFVGRSEDPTFRVARRLIALAIAATASETGSLSELLVVAPADAQVGLREQLLELTSDLVYGNEGVALAVRLRFEQLGPLDAPAAGAMS
jgi:hypothetical protein